LFSLSVFVIVLRNSYKEYDEITMDLQAEEECSQKKSRRARIALRADTIGYAA
jgi:hypothetical protein